MYIIKQAHAKVTVSFSSSAGYTLIELMVSMVLGLLLVAAASQLFMGGLISAKLQQGGADIQDNALYGLNFVTKDIRLANYGNVTRRLLNDTTASGGIVFTAATASNAIGADTNLNKLRQNLAGSFIDPVLLTHGDSENGWNGLSNVASLKSDQLTIQFTAPYAMSNCTGTPVAMGDLVIERYFLRVDDATTANVQNLALACAAGVVTPEQAETKTSAAIAPYVTGLDGAGQIIMGRVDHLHFLLGTQDGVGGNLAYYTIKQYRALPVPHPRIVSIQMAALVRSVDNTNSALVSPTKSFVMFDQTVTPKAETNQNTNRFVRQVYVTTIALRNAMGAES